MKIGDLVKYIETGEYVVITERWGWPSNPKKPTFLRLAGKDREVFRSEHFEVDCETR